MENILEQLKNAPRTRAKLSDFIKIKHGYAFKGEHFSAQPTKDVLVTPGNFAIGGGFKAEKYKYYAGPVPEDYVLNEGDLVVTMTDLSVNADTLGYSALIPKVEGVRFLHNQRVGLVQKINDGIDMNFLYFLMRTREYQSYVVGGASGSTVKHTSPDRIASFVYDFPPIDLQEKVAETLMKYEDKCSNNSEIVRALESLIETTFLEWFVSNVSEQALSVSTIGNYCQTYGGGTPSTKDQKNWKDGKIPWATPSDLTNQKSIFIDHTERSITEVGLQNSSAHLLPKNSILMTSRATVGVVSIARVPMSTNQGFISCVCESPEQTTYLFWWLKTHTEAIQGLATGSTFPEISRSVFRNIEIGAPEIKQLKRFHDFADNLMSEIEVLKYETVRLQEQKATLFGLFL